LLTWLPLLAFLAVGCAPANYGKSAYGTDGYSLKNAHASPPSLMVAHKVERPLYLVLDPGKVKDTWELQTYQCEVGGAGCEHFKLTDFHEFVRRDLKHAMEAYFARVEVVDSASAIPPGESVVADVKVDAIKMRPMVTGILTHVFIQMTWGFALRPSEATEYTYSFAGTAESNDSYPTFEAGCGQLVENAIPAMLKKWVEEGGIDALAKPSKAPKTKAKGPASI
jgi:hypothetical protein